MKENKDIAYFVEKYGKQKARKKYIENMQFIRESFRESKLREHDRYEKELKELDKKSNRQ